MQKSTNPFSLEIPYEAPFNELKDIKKHIQKLDVAFHIWKNQSLEHRLDAILNVSKNLETQKQNLATHISQEMGKPITQALAEIKKSIAGIKPAFIISV